MKKKILAAIGVLALMLGLNLSTASGAVAASNGRHTQTFSCTGGGTEKEITITYDTFGIGNSDPNGHQLVAFIWHTTPNADLDRISLYVDSDNNGGYDYFWWSRGGEASTQNDVPAEGGYYSYGDDGPVAYFDNGSPGDIKWNTYGGVGSSTNNCSQAKHPIS